MLQDSDLGASEKRPQVVSQLMRLLMSGKMTTLILYRGKDKIATRGTYPAKVERPVSKSSLKNNERRTMPGTIGFPLGRGRCPWGFWELERWVLIDLQHEQPRSRYEGMLLGPLLRKRRLRPMSRLIFH
jgi:hypothetical protein